MSPLEGDRAEGDDEHQARDDGHDFTVTKPSHWSLSLNARA